MQQIDQTGVAARDVFVLLDTLKLALVRAVVVEVAASDDLEREIFAGDTAGQPDFAERPAADGAHEFVHQPDGSMDSSQVLARNNLGGSANSGGDKANPTMRNNGFMFLNSRNYVGMSN